MFTFKETKSVYSRSKLKVTMERQEGRKEMFYLTTHSTHFIYGYMVKDHSDSERGKPAAATWATLSD